MDKNRPGNASRQVEFKCSIILSRIILLIYYLRFAAGAMSEVNVPFRVFYAGWFIILTIIIVTIESLDCRQKTAINEISVEMIHLSLKRMITVDDWRPSNGNETVFFSMVFSVYETADRLKSSKLCSLDVLCGDFNEKMLSSVFPNYLTVYSLKIFLE